MASPRFFCPIPLENNTLVTLPSAAAHHAGRSLRLREGTRIVLFNGQGGEYHGTLQFNGGIAQAALDTFVPHNRTLNGKITLIQALASGDKMDWIIEKAVELGVDSFIPIQAERSIVQLSGNRLEKRQQHWQGIIQSACEQSGRNQLMHLHPVQSLKEVFSLTQSAQLLVADPDSEQTLSSYLQHQQHLTHIGFFVGPEGGWSDKEMQFMCQQGATLIRFGERVLRTETAGLALSSATASLLNWM